MTADGAAAAHRDAVIAHERRRIRASAAVVAVAATSAAAWQVQRARAERDGLTVCAAGLGLVATALTQVEQYRRVERDVDAARERRAATRRAARRRRETGPGAPGRSRTNDGRCSCCGRSAW